MFISFQSFWHVIWIGDILWSVFGRLCKNPFIDHNSRFDSRGLIADAYLCALRFSFLLKLDHSWPEKDNATTTTPKTTTPRDIFLHFWFDLHTIFEWWVHFVLRFCQALKLGSFSTISTQGMQLPWNHERKNISLRQISNKSNKQAILA